MSFRDASPPPEVVDDATAAMLRQKTPQERLKMAFELWEFARSVVRSRLRHEHPDWSDEQIQRETARRMSGGALDKIYEAK